MSYRLLKCRLTEGIGNHELSDTRCSTVAGAFAAVTVHSKCWFIAFTTSITHNHQWYTFFLSLSLSLYIYIYIYIYTKLIYRKIDISDVLNIEPSSSDTRMTGSWDLKTKCVSMFRNWYSINSLMSCYKSLSHGVYTEKGSRIKKEVCCQDQNSHWSDRGPTSSLFFSGYYGIEVSHKVCNDCTTVVFTA